MNPADEISDEEVVKNVLEGETALYELLVHRYEQRLFRVCRAILRNNSEARDVVQHTYAQAYEHLRQFEGRSKFSTWLTTIAIHEASLRRRRSSRVRSLGQLHGGRGRTDSTLTPEEHFSLTETRRILESMIDMLPEKYRVVQIMRDVEGMSVAEAAECLGIRQENVKVRLHRARALLRKRLYELFGSKVSDVFRFHLSRCDRVVQEVSERTSPYQKTAVPVTTALPDFQRMSLQRGAQPINSERLVAG